MGVPRQASGLNVSGHCLHLQRLETLSPKLELTRDILVSSLIGIDGALGNEAEVIPEDDLTV